MVWFDIVKRNRVKFEPETIRKILRELMEKEKRLILNDDVTKEILDKYFEILDERRNSMLYTGDKSSLAQQKSSLTSRFRRDTRGLILILHNFIKPMFKRITVGRDIIYFVNEKELENFKQERASKRRNWVKWYNE